MEGEKEVEQEKTGDKPWFSLNRDDQSNVHIAIALSLAAPSTRLGIVETWQMNSALCRSVTGPLGVNDIGARIIEGPAVPNQDKVFSISSCTSRS